MKKELYRQQTREAGIPEANPAGSVLVSGEAGGRSV